MHDGISARECDDAEQWDRFLDRVPWATAQHAFGYGQLLASCFHYVRPTYRVFSDDGRIVAGLPLIRFRAGGPFRAIYSLVFSMYGGPLVDPDFLNDPAVWRRIVEETDDEAARYGAFEARFTVPPTAPDAVNRYMQTGRRIEVLRRECPLLDLDRPLDQIVGGFHPSARRGVRRSQRQGLLVRNDADATRVRMAYPLYRARMAQIGATAKPWRFLQGILEKKLGVAFLAEWQDRIVGLLILLVSRRAAIFWTSAMDESASTCRPMNALMDAAIRWSHASGIPVFNFGESFGGRPGLVRFKKNWGPRAAHNVVTIRTYRPWVRRTWLALEQPARYAYTRWDAWRHPFRADDLS